jgi:predicted RNA-binding Zn ribbon-like protein
MAAVSIQIPAFDDLSGNWLCLDFTHTLTERYSPQPQELLNSYSDLVAWGSYERLLTDEEAQQLLWEANNHPEEASAAQERALELRETIYQVFYALSEGSSPEQSDLALLNERLAEAMSHACLVPDGGTFRWDWATNEQAFDRILWLVARSAADLLTSEKLHDVRASAQLMIVSGCFSMPVRIIAVAGVICRPAATRPKPAGTLAARRTL